MSIRVRLVLHRSSVSLRVRLVLLIVALVALVVLALSWVYLDGLVNSLSAGALERSVLASQQLQILIGNRINQRSQDYPPSVDLESAKTMWSEIVTNDPDITATLQQTLNAYETLVEITVAGQNGDILASTDRTHVGQKMIRIEEFTAWRALPVYRRLYDLLERTPDYDVVVPLGMRGQKETVFTLHVIASGVFLRNAVLPDVKRLATVSSGSFLLSIALTVLATSRILRPLGRIEQTIDRIAQGNFRGDETGFARDQPKEFAAVESKLNLLGQKYSGARLETTHLKQSLDVMVERMATQLDVATRFAAISRISGGVAHEIKNPLNAIVLRLDLLRERAASGATEHEILPEIDVLSKEVRRLDRVVKTFLDFSKPVEVRMTEVDLGTLASEVATLMKPQARLANIEIVLKIADETPIQAPGASESDSSPATASLSIAAPSPHNSLWIHGDADMLKQAILNLVTNALEAMRDAGVLTLALARRDDSVVLEISDTGPGIPPEVRDKVFQLYFTTKERGSGIGLAMTYRAVQLHNGTVDFVSEKGRGTTFRLQFPALVRHG
jgi:signal transduction histidine kinase